MSYLHEIGAGKGQKAAVGVRWQLKGLREMSRYGADRMAAATAIGEDPSGLLRDLRACWCLENAKGWREMGPDIGILAHPRSSAGVRARGRSKGLDAPCR